MDCKGNKANGGQSTLCYFTLNQTSQNFKGLRRLKLDLSRVKNENGSQIVLRSNGEIAIVVGPHGIFSLSGKGILAKLSKPPMGGTSRQNSNRKVF